MDQTQINQTRKKLLLIGIISTVCLLYLLGRLYYIQIIKNDLYLSEVNYQRNIDIPVNSGRGNIVDRNFISFTDRQEKTVLLISNKVFEKNERNLAIIEEITGITINELEEALDTPQQIVELELLPDIEISNGDLLIPKGVYFFEKKLRYQDNQRLAHIIGYINSIDHNGMSGLEKSFNEVLFNSNKQKVTAVLDGKKRILPGAGFSTVAEEGKHLQLTIDYHLQTLGEEALKNQNKNGAVVISNIKTGELLSIASSPTYNPNRIQNHMNSYGDELYNKALQMSFPPGSIFKLIVTAAALEEEQVTLDEVFHCNGQQEIGNVVIKCSAHNNIEEGLDITFQQAVAESCNSTLIQVGQRVGAKKIILMAKVFGLGERVDIGVLEEEKGHLPSGDHILGPAIGNISIGQGDIEVTPLQINQLTQIIANDGIKKDLYLIDKVIDDDYDVIEEFDKPQEERVISQEIAEALQDLMKRVMTSGTGKTIGELGNVTAGKTGTAQSAHKGEEIFHGWFTGYYPNDEPKYGVTVFIQQGGSGGRNAVPVFKEILEKMMELGY
ncbi:peptidoglycan D,D-transpeptidase FtsI family protein [Alkaliphilus serpentinus]|uniref:Penicillin-binding protein 2 n=1 Tax=Alkaliphilus serpentinus TaxID=1482731 RepID=A0A833M9E7_9FIRM|nr:penicillin-binding protein 2 [Alkaliphilus serpentinus]KAB3527609.1 penicillin-binding protein 2 [Alkaliphilus serpentinus]